MRAEFLTELDCRYINDGQVVLLAPLRYYSNILKSEIDVPAGFVSDFASVPRVPIVYEAFGDKAHMEAVVHDYLYQKHLVSKHKADRVFLEAMKSRRKPLWVRWGMYLGVVFGGQGAYNSGPDRYRVPDKKFWPSLSDGKKE
jgi:hypothetical protein